MNPTQPSLIYVGITSRCCLEPVSDTVEASLVPEYRWSLTEDGLIQFLWCKGDWKKLILRKIEGRRRRRWQRMRRLDSITDSMDMNLSKLLDIVEDRGVRSAAVHGVTKSGTGLSDWTAAKCDRLSVETVSLNFELGSFLEIAMCFMMRWVEFQVCHAIIN